MKITKAELIELRACEDGIQRFIKQTGNTDEPVEVASLVGGENTYSDLLWLAGKKLPKERIVRFACDCALVNIEKIKPYTDEYDFIVEFLRNPTAGYSAAATATAADAAARAACAARATAWAARATAWAARTTVRAAVAAGAVGHADVAAGAVGHAINAGGEEQINELLKELFE